MLFNDVDVHIVAPTEAERSDAASSLGSVSVRYDMEDGVLVLRHCSGFLISRQHVLTTAHCVRSNLVFDQKYIAASADVLEFATVSFGSTVRFRFDGESLSEQANAGALPALGMPLYQNPTLDFAVFALPASVPSKFVDLAAISITSEREDIGGEELRAYGYPNGIPLAISGNCQSASCVLEHVLLHDCDTMPGSSGGLLVSAASGLGVAMHLGTTGWNDVAYYEKVGHFESPADLETTTCDSAMDAPLPACFTGPRYNKAMKLTAIARDIQQRAPLVWRNIVEESAAVSNAANAH